MFVGVEYCEEGTSLLLSVDSGFGNFPLLVGCGGL
jgi:hypothetical protein